MRHKFTDIVGKLTKIYPNNEAQSIAFILFEDLLNIHKTLIFTSNANLSAVQQSLLDVALERLLRNEPIQYVTGETWFSGLKLLVNSDVLIPRQETELLVKLIYEDYKNGNPIIYDIGTGSGCIALALKNLIKDSEVYAADISVKALNVARKNAELNKLNVTFFECNILNYQKWSSINFIPDIIVSNPPYIGLVEKASVPNNVKDFEPELALFVPDSDPLIFYKAIAEFSIEKLKKRGSLYFEINEKYGEEILYMLDNMGFKGVKVFSDLNGKQRIIKASKE